MPTSLSGSTATISEQCLGLYNVSSSNLPEIQLNELYWCKIKLLDLRLRYSSMASGSLNLTKCLPLGSRVAVPWVVSLSTASIKFKLGVLLESWEEKG